VISASESAWFSIMVDGVQRSYTFEKDDSAEFRFRRQAILRLGNAGGVSIIYDGAAQPSAGERGTVRNMVFPPTAQ
jgi:cytoskeleton protein RodZ